MRQSVFAVLFATTALTPFLASAADDLDITKTKGLVGPGTISLETKGDIMFSIGGQARFVPVVEENWDFGASESVNDAGVTERLDVHGIEAGRVKDSYIRGEGRLFFNALPKDHTWSFTTTLEFDRPLDQVTVDDRGGAGDTSDFGMERLLGTVALPGNNRLYAGWDVWGVDMAEAQGFVYADDNPGIWLKGGEGSVDYSLAYFKVRELDVQVGPGAADPSSKEDDDRDVIGGYVDFKPAPGHKIRGFYLFDRIGEANMPGGVPTFANQFTAGQGTSSANSHHLGAYWTGKIGSWGFMTEGVYQFGTAEASTAVGPAGNQSQREFDISAYALAADVTYDLEAFSIPVTPRVGVMYTSGDDSAGDDKLGGYTSVTDFSRFSKWGGENRILSDGNDVLGTRLYSFLPEGLGNGTPLVTGGIGASGRGDNPGISMASFGFTARPMPAVTYNTNLNAFWWNEAQRVTSWVDGATVTTVDAGYVGTEWSHELAWKINPAVTVKGQAAFFFAGDAVEDATSALTASAAGPGPRSDDVAMRLGAELIWLF